MLGLTTKQIYFSGSRKRFRVRYDRIVTFDPYDDGSGIMRDAQTAKPQTFRTGDGWFAYNLATNLAQMGRGRPHWHDTVPFLRRARRLWKYGAPSLAPRPSRTAHRPGPVPDEIHPERPTTGEGILNACRGTWDDPLIDESKERRPTVWSI